MDRRALFPFVVAAVGWGTGGIATRAAFNDGVGAWTMVTIRIAIAAALLAVMLAVQKGHRIDRLNLTIGAVMALLNLLGPYVLFTFAYDEASAGFVGLFAALIPLVTAIYAHYMLEDEPMTRAKLTGLSVGFAGVVVLLASGDTGLGGEGRPLVAAGLSLIAVAMIGYAGAYARRYAGTYDATTVTGVQFGLAAILLIPVMLVIEGVPTGISPQGWSLMVYMGVASSFIPFLIFYWLLRTIAVTTVSLIGYLVPLIALVGGIILLGEQLETGIAVGGLLIFAGMVLTDRAGRVASSRFPVPREDQPTTDNRQLTTDN